MTLNSANPDFPILLSNARLSAYGSSKAALPYQRVSTNSAPYRNPKSNTPYVDAINQGEFSYYPKNIYDKEPLYLPKFQQSGVWNMTRPYGPPGSSHPPGSEHGRWKADPTVFSMITGGVLPPNYSNYVPPDFAPSPNPGIGISYVQCARFPGDQNRNAVNQPAGFAPLRFYQ